MLTAATQVTFKNCAPFKDCRTKMILLLIMHILLILQCLCTIWSNIATILQKVYGVSKEMRKLIAGTETDGTKKRIKIVVPLKYLNNFWRSLEIPLTSCKVKLSLNWIENCVLTMAVVGADSATFKITNAKLYVPVVNLSVEDNVKLTKQLNKGFKRSVYWNEYKVIHN